MSPTVAIDITQHAKPPRALYLPFMMGHHFGVPFHNELQATIIKRLLTMLETVHVSGQIEKFEVTWAEARTQGKKIEKETGRS